MRWWLPPSSRRPAPVTFPAAEPVCGARVNLVSNTLPVMDIEPVVNALLSELHRQGQAFDSDRDAPFVGPTDIPAAVLIDGPIDVEALAAAVIIPAIGVSPPN